MTEFALISPEGAWPVDEEYRHYYATGVESGREIAATSSVVFVSIARNAMPAIVNTLGLAVAAMKPFQDRKMYVFENDSEDGTGDLLDSLSADEKFSWLTVERESLGGIDSRGFDAERTERLAYCRNKCLEWVRRNAADSTWTVVLDADPQGGFSVDGVLNSVARLSERGGGGMASYSLLRNPDGIAHYDAWAARPTCWWRDRRDEIGFTWFSAFLPPVGSPPMAMNSAFGGLAVYSTTAFLAGGYSGGDCEHVSHHKRMHEAGYQMWLNPGSRYIAIWTDGEKTDS